MMTTEEMYEFDLNGYIVYRNVLSPEEIDKINTIIDSAEAGGKRKFSFFHLDPYFLDLMAHPQTLAVLKVMLGDWLRFDHAFGMEMSNTSRIPEDLHAGPLQEQLAFFYQWSQNQMRNGLVKVIYALNDVNPGDGGFICVPGSHKANVKYMPKPDFPLVVNPTLKAGDMLIFTEALVHGSKPWKAEQRRRVLIYSYAPGCLVWMNNDWCEPYRSLASTPVQKELLRPPHVGYCDQNFDISDGRFPRASIRSSVPFPKDEVVHSREVEDVYKKTRHSARLLLNGLQELRKLIFSS
ncbi:phytanoyl-CoA dioxygenase family protein [Crocosphaera sp.]|uniref:phytanoyl-CoA dioxygenase family protein n=1 Tax=Crocosphaera sp. TaxID=2729996 RepID=UPI003F2584EF|nr:phytanoyl-CoA dioxygenase family protein [Crocosphaera sp.]